MLIKEEVSVHLSFCSLSLSPSSLLSSLKNIEGKSIYSYSLSPSPSLPPLLEGRILRKYIEEAHRGREAYKGKEAHRGREAHKGKEVYRGK